MQEAKQFPTAFFGFERKSVLDYIYEQDRQAREALEELARRNDVLDRKAAELGDKLAALTADLFKGRHEDFNGLKNQLDEIKTQFAERLSQFERDFNRLESEVPCCRAAAAKAGDKDDHKPAARRVTLRRRGAPQQSEESAKMTGGAASRVCKILNEWK